MCSRQDCNNRANTYSLVCLSALTLEAQELQVFPGQACVLLLVRVVLCMGLLLLLLGRLKAGGSIERGLFNLIQPCQAPVRTGGEGEGRGSKK